MTEGNGLAEKGQFQAVSIEELDVKLDRALTVGEEVKRTEVRGWQKRIESTLEKLECQIAEVARSDAELRSTIEDLKVWRDGMDGHRAQPSNPQPVSAELRPDKKDVSGICPFECSDASRVDEDDKEAAATVAHWVEVFKNIREYPWEDSVYEALFLIRLPFITVPQSCLIILGFGLNCFMIITTLVNIARPEFKSEKYQNVESFSLWRLSDGTSYMYADPLTQATLTTRVCGRDPGLSLGLYQRDVVDTILDYTNMDYGSRSGTKPGAVLCNVAVILWVCCCVLELRTVLNFTVAIWGLPRGGHTRVHADEDGWKLVSLSWLRLAHGTNIALFRAGSAIAMMVYGCEWLASTPQIENLLLNASALGFVLDIDNTIFQCVAPLRMLSLFARLKPVPIPQWKELVLIPYIVCLSIVIYICVLNFHMLNGVIESMEQSFKVLCEPLEAQTIMTGRAPLGWVTYTNNTPAWQEHVSMSQQRGHQSVDVAKKILSFDEYSDHYAYQVGDMETVAMYSAQSIADFVDKFDCHDYNALPEGKGSLGKRLYAATGNSSLLPIAGCDEALQYCFEEDLASKNVRFMCAQSCGCGDPFGGLWDLAINEQGCPENICKRVLGRKLKNARQTCEDVSIADLSTIPTWGKMLRRMLKLGDVTEIMFNNLTELGCGAFTHFDDFQLLDLCALSDQNRQLGAAAFCPVSCKCRENSCIGMCPKVCCEK